MGPVLLATSKWNNYLHLLKNETEMQGSGAIIGHCCWLSVYYVSGLQVRVSHMLFYFNPTNCLIVISTL